MTLETITSRALAPARHGFFTRKGGASSGVFAGLNCGSGSSDQSDVVAINRARAATAMGATPDMLVALKQTHSATAVLLTELPQGAPAADAAVTRQRGIVLSVLTADCAPVLFADMASGVIGVAHAGWKGALSGVLETTIDRMVEAGANRSGIVAVIGPTISQAAYEVGPEFLQRFMDDDPQNARFFANGKSDRYQFDLPGFALHRLRESGIGHAEWTRHCTYSDPDRFFSFRRSVHEKSADYGRLISTIRL